MACNHPLSIKQNGIPVQVPCGKCYGCKKSRRNGWFVRFIEETKHSKAAFFLTLTYREEEVPILHTEEDGDLKVVNYEDVQLFLKRWRKKLAEYGITLRFFCCSEYGSRTDRPHYHMLVWFDKPLDCLRMKAQQRKDLFERIWDKGFIAISPITRQRLYYVTKYILKKKDGCKANLYRPMRSYCSLGIGKEYITDSIIKYHKRGLAALEKGSHFLLYRSQDGFFFALPRYYKDKIFNDVEKIQINVKRAYAAAFKALREYDANLLREQEFYEQLKEKHYDKLEDPEKRKVAWNTFKAIFLSTYTSELEEREQELIKKEFKSEAL